MCGNGVFVCSYIYYSHIFFAPHNHPSFFGQLDLVQKLLPNCPVILASLLTFFYCSVFL